MLLVRGVGAHYGPIQALFGVDLEVGQGEVVSLIGSNGAGKTTLLSLVSGLIRPTSGQVIYEGRDITRRPVKDIVRLGVIQVPEGRQIFKSLTVLENLEMGAFARSGAGRDSLVRDLNKVYQLFPILEERRGQLGGTLSGGEQQMLAMGRALMGRPKLLLLDEPSLGLAPLMAAEIMRTVTRLKEQGVTILLVEQNARAALRISDRAYVLETGRVGLHGRAEDLLNDPAVARAFLGRPRSQS